VPVDGFYEWNQTTKPKQPHYFFMRDEKPFFIAGLWEYWSNKSNPTQRREDAKNGEEMGKGEQKQTITSFTLITTEANAVLAKVHDRMPVILEEKDFAAWLDPANQNIGELQKLLMPFPIRNGTLKQQASTGGLGPEALQRIQDGFLPGFNLRQQRP
jgi:putative SOS response-associated peptidase YedK